MECRTHGFSLPDQRTARVTRRQSGVTGPVAAPSTGVSGPSEERSREPKARARMLAYPRRAASIVAMSIFLIDIMAEKARFASAPPAASASVRARGVICQDRPQRSLHQPH